MPAGGVPEHGDVVVVPEVRRSHLEYVMRINGGGDQIAFATRADATANALAFAQRARVTAWYGDRRELGLVLLGCFRTETNRRQDSRRRA
jgi:hypothetical protein